MATYVKTMLMIKLVSHWRDIISKTFEFKHKKKTYDDDKKGVPVSYEEWSISSNDTTAAATTAGASAVLVGGYVTLIRGVDEKVVDVSESVH